MKFSLFALFSTACVAASLEAQNVGVAPVQEVSYLEADTWDLKASTKKSTKKQVKNIQKATAMAASTQEAKDLLGQAQKLQNVGLKMLAKGDVPTTHTDGSPANGASTSKTVETHKSAKDKAKTAEAQAQKKSAAKEEDRQSQKAADAHAKAK